MFLLGPVLLFAVARTSNGLSKVTETVEGLGEVGAVCDGGEMYVEVDEKAFVGLAAAVTATIDMPEDPDCSPFDHVYLSFEPVGPAWGIRPGTASATATYGVPHADVHFFIVSREYSATHMGECEVVPGAANCDGTLEANADFFEVPPVEYTNGFFADESFGGNAVPGHGMHMVPLSDGVPGGPTNCVSTGDGVPGWVDCLTQQLGVLGVTEDPPAFVDRGCTCGPWAEGASPILLTFDGHVVGYEIMPSQAHAARLGADLPNPYVATYPRQDRKETSVEASGHHPTHIRSFRDNLKIQFGLTLASDDGPRLPSESESDAAAARVALTPTAAAVAAAAAAAALV